CSGWYSRPSGIESLAANGGLLHSMKWWFDDRRGTLAPTYVDCQLGTQCGERGVDVREPDPDAEQRGEGAAGDHAAFADRVVLPGDAGAVDRERDELLRRTR